MTAIPATEFARNFGRYREAAQRAPVAVAVHDRVAGYFVSSHDYEEYQQLKAMQSRALHPHELSPDDLDMIRTAQVPDSARELDHLLD